MAVVFTRKKYDPWKGGDYRYQFETDEFDGAWWVGTDFKDALHRFMAETGIEPDIIFDKDTDNWDEIPESDWK